MTRKMTVTGVKWEMKRHGEIYPVILLDAEVTPGLTSRERVVLGNTGYLEELDISMGCVVRLPDKRSRQESIEAVLEDKGGDKILPPEVCPFCYSLVERVKFDGYYRSMCPDYDRCPEQIANRITHFASVNAMNIKGLHKSTATKFVSGLRVETVADLYDISYVDLSVILRLGGTNSDKIYEGIIESMDTTLDRFIYALNIKGVGPKAAKLIANQYDDIYEFIEDEDDEKFARIEGVGEVVVGNIRKFIRDEKNKELVYDLLSRGVNPRK